MAKQNAASKPQKLVLRGLNIRQVPTYLNRLGLDARNIVIKRISDNSVIFTFDSGTNALSGLQNLARHPGRNPTKTLRVPHS